MSDSNVNMMITDVSAMQDDSNVTMGGAAINGSINGGPTDLEALCQSQAKLIESLKLTLEKQNHEIREINSQLDMYKSIFNVGSSRRSQAVDSFGVPLPFNVQPKQNQPRKTRLMGISAEPQASLSLLELMETKFAEYPKSQAYESNFNIRLANSH